MKYRISGIEKYMVIERYERIDDHIKVYNRDGSSDLVPYDKKREDKIIATMHNQMGSFLDRHKSRRGVTLEVLRSLSDDEDEPPLVFGGLVIILFLVFSGIINLIGFIYKSVIRHSRKSSIKKYNLFMDNEELFTQAKLPGGTISNVNNETLIKIKKPKLTPINTPITINNIDQISLKELRKLKNEIERYNELIKEEDSRELVLTK